MKSQTIRFLEIPAGHQTRLKSRPGLPERVHVFDQDSIDAVNAALAAKRPLLVRGEPGTGKSQLARAVARELKRAFVQQVIDAHCESRDLMWHFDAVQRLADAQLGQALQKGAGEMETTLKLENYLHPGPLWWAFNWRSAKAQADKERLKLSSPHQEEEYAHAPNDDYPSNGCVLLIDEIDKAEIDVPNGLLEALGEGCFTPPGRAEPVIACGTPPLVIITTNEERALPPAFMRRCLVLYLSLEPTEEEEAPHKLEKLVFSRREQALIDTLIARGLAHFPELDETKTVKKVEKKSQEPTQKQKTVLQTAAELLVRDRRQARENQWQPLPGQAEYLDLLRAVTERAPGNTQKQLELLEQVSRFVVTKHKGEGI